MQIENANLLRIDDRANRSKACAVVRLLVFTVLHKFPVEEDGEVGEHDNTQYFTITVSLLK